MENSTGLKPEFTDYECECLEEKKFRVVFDGDSTGKYSIDYCQKCYDQDDKLFMVSMEELL